MLEQALQIATGFAAGDDGAAEKSRKLTCDLLTHTPEPFSRNQFTPGHITCTALVLHPSEELVLFMHHHRLRRWLLPGGHVEPGDPSLAGAAAREAVEETRVQINPSRQPFLVGIDVHGIPPKDPEPFHLHHDLIWCFRAAAPEIAISDEAPEVRWSADADLDAMGVADSIRCSIARARLAAW